jgi:hypothetical protein
MVATMRRANREDLPTAAGQTKQRTLTGSVSPNPSVGPGIRTHAPASLGQRATLVLHRLRKDKNP